MQPEQSMNRHVSRVVAVGIVSGSLVTLAARDAVAQPSTRWPIHSPDRPQPRVVKPPANQWTVAPPADAIVLFSGTDLAKWKKDDEHAAGWKIENGYMEVMPGARSEGRRVGIEGRDGGGLG